MLGEMNLSKVAAITLVVVVVVGSALVVVAVVNVSNGE